MLQSPRFKDHMKAIGIDQSLSNSALSEHIYIQNIKKLYQHAEKCKKRQKFKDIPESAMVYTPEVFTNNSPRSPINPTPVKKLRARKSLCLFTNLLDVKNKTVIC